MSGTAWQKAGGSPGGTHQAELMGTEPGCLQFVPTDVWVSRSPVTQHAGWRGESKCHGSERLCRAREASLRGYPQGPALSARGWLVGRAGGHGDEAVIAGTGVPARAPLAKVAGALLPAPATAPSPTLTALTAALPGCGKGGFALTLLHCIRGFLLPCGCCTRRQQAFGVPVSSESSSTDSEGEARCR